MASDSVRRLKQLEDRMHRFDPTRERFYLEVDPAQYEKARGLLLASERASQTLEDEERRSPPLEAGEKELLGPANSKE